MPTVARQLSKPVMANGPPQQKPKTGSVIDRIAPVGAPIIGRLKVSLYGNPKTGKTRLACTFPKPLLIIGTEDGTDSIKGMKGVDFVQMETSSEIYTLIEGPVAAGRWTTVVLDNGTKLRDMRIAELWRERGGPIPDRKPFLFADAAWKQVWVQSSNDMKDMLRPLLDLPRKVDLNVVIIAQEQDFTAEGNSAGSDLLKPSISSALGKSVAQFVNAECSYIGQCFIREQTREVKSKGPGGTESRSVIKTGKKEYCLRVGPHEIFWTGFRQRIGAPELPECIIDPHYDKIAKLIAG